ncbi:clathrin assembly protein [Populus alba x Populus x berolinensis]|nr:clathrin assembly protein [Populus alba x Populus x berolinensis]
MVLFCEILIDNIKHPFLAKFNDIKSPLHTLNFLKSFETRLLIPNKNTPCRSKLNSLPLVDMHKRFRQVFLALKEHSSVSYAKIATVGGFCDVDLIIVKATAPDDLSLPEKYVHELLKNYYGRDPMVCSLSIHVISKTIHLQILKITPCLLGHTHNYSTNLLVAFPWKTREQKKPSNGCTPTGVAARSLIVQLAMKLIIRDSVICYTTFRREIVLVLDNLLEMPYSSCVSAFGIYKKSATQASQLCEFYDWCKAKGFCGSYEYPFIDKIPRIHIQALETFLNGMWQLTDQSSTSTTSPSSWVESKSTSTDDDQVVQRNNLLKISSQLEKSDENGFAKNIEMGNEEMENLIQLEDGEDHNWEALLEASLNSFSNDPRKHLLIYPQILSNGHGDGHGYENQLICLKGTKGEEQDQWQMQVYNPNPFHQPRNYFPHSDGSSSAGDPAFPWGF